MFPESLAPAAQYNIGKKIFLAFFGDFFIPRVRKEKGIVGLLKGDNFSRKNVRKSAFSFKTVREGRGKVR